MSTGPLDDEELIALYRAGGGSPQARRHVEELFQRYHARVAAWCLRFTGDRESAADLAQEVLMKAYTHLDSFEGSARFSTWIYSIARNHCFNYVRSRARRPEHGAEELPPDVQDPGSIDVLQRLEREAGERQALQIVNSVLDEVEKKVMVLHYAEDIPLDSVTSILGLQNASGAKAYIVSAKRKLKRALERRRAEA